MAKKDIRKTIFEFGLYTNAWSALDYHITIIILDKFFDDIGASDNEDLDDFLDWFIAGDKHQLGFTAKKEIAFQILDKKHSKLLLKHNKTFTKGILENLYKHRNMIAHGYLVPEDQQKDKYITMKQLKKSFRDNGYQNDIDHAAHNQFFKNLELATNSLREIIESIGIYNEKGIYVPKQFRPPTQ
jgi:hypothetical protein